MYTIQEKLCCVFLPIWHHVKTLTKRIRILNASRVATRSLSGAARLGPEVEAGVLTISPGTPQRLLVLLQRVGFQGKTPPQDAAASLRLFSTVTQITLQKWVLPARSWETNVQRRAREKGRGNRVGKRYRIRLLALLLRSCWVLAGRGTLSVLKSSLIGLDGR